MYANGVSEARTGANGPVTADRLASRLREVFGANVIFSGIVGTAAIVVFDGVEPAERREIVNRLKPEFGRGLSVRRHRRQPCK